MQNNAISESRIVGTIEDLEALAERGSQLASWERIELQLSELSEEENYTYQEIINSHLTACGCGEGKLTLGILVAAYVLYLSYRPEGFHDLGWVAYGIGFALACLGAMIGKVYGLTKARRRLVAAVGELRLHVLGNGPGAGMYTK